MFDSEIKELYNTPAKADVIPINGYIKYPQGNRDGGITISSVQDAEEESDEVFTVKLISAKGGATISDADLAATLTGKIYYIIILGIQILVYTVCHSV